MRMSTMRLLKKGTVALAVMAEYLAGGQPGEEKQPALAGWYAMSAAAALGVDVLQVDGLGELLWISMVDHIVC